MWVIYVQGMKFTVDGKEYDCRKIKGFDHYFVSKCGNIISTWNGKKKQKNPKLMNPYKRPSGYVLASFRKKIEGSKKYYFYVHRIVCEYFIGRAKKGQQVNHKNFIKSDNRLENLEYVTAKENNTHAILGNRMNPPKGEMHSNTNLKNEDIFKIRKMLKAGIKQKDIGKMFNVSQVCVSDIHRGRRWGHLKDKK